MSSSTFAIEHGYAFAPQYSKSVAYFSMEFAIDQALKTYSGGLGFLAGSHMRSAYELKQNLIGIGMLWKQGYYDQVRAEDNSMGVQFREKIYSFLEDTGVKFTIQIENQDVWVAVYHLPAGVFGTVPMFFLTTDTDGNDLATREISYRLYSDNLNTKIAQCMVLGLGGAKFLDHIGHAPDVYHLNEAHALSSVFHLLKKYKGQVSELRKKLIFTTHTPEEAGNEKHDFELLYQLGFFNGYSIAEVQSLTHTSGQVFNHSLLALRLARKANAVSKLHGEVSRDMWKNAGPICEITHVTNAQNGQYWKDSILDNHLQNKDLDGISSRKKELKTELFKTVADQVGKLFDPETLTIVWARRFAAYKRPDLLTRSRERFDALMKNSKYPIQFIWAGKPYPKDFGATGIFNDLYYLSHHYKNMAVLTGYELALSRQLKNGSDLWLNTPIVTREASGTSGMTAAMNASVNISTYDGWLCEFAQNQHNAFIAPVAVAEPDWLRDKQDIDSLFDLLENTILPMYYDRPAAWQQVVYNSMAEVSPFFESGRMAAEYYEKVY